MIDSCAPTDSSVSASCETIPDGDRSYITRDNVRSGILPWPRISLYRNRPCAAVAVIAMIALSDPKSWCSFLHSAMKYGFSFPVLPALLLLVCPAATVVAAVNRLRSRLIQLVSLNIDCSIIAIDQLQLESADTPSTTSPI